MTSKETNPVTEPTKTMSWEDFYSKSKTDNANKLMDRVWYCIACTDKNVAEQKIFWEHWYWKEDTKGEENLLNGKKEACNHTVTVSTEGKEIDYPIWPLAFTNESMKMYPAIDLKCFVIAPFGLNMQPIAFPTDDSPQEFRVDYCQVMGTKMYFIFVLDPMISEEDKKKNFDVLETENGVLREWFHDVQWQSGYVLGSAGEPDINPKK
mmetsp:Transcript_2562/g.3589  ORF Transcript_2562/g.3589 Transcript_2562/m.3589 type:complete len:208 (+) Transcript_2562:83-706(+)